MLLVRNLVQISRRSVSALYVTGDKASEQCSILRPHLDFERRLKNRPKLQENIERRRLKTKHKLTELYQFYEMYSTITRRMAGMEQRRTEIRAELQHLYQEKEKTGKENVDASRKTREEYTQVNEDLKQLKLHSYSVEDQFAHHFLALPNEIHAKTPDTLTILSSHGEPSNEEPQTNWRGLVDYFDETAFYLERDAAKFDLFFPQYWVDQLRGSGYVHFANPAFTKSIVVEAAGLSQSDVFEVRNEDLTDSVHLLHLVGQSSMASFLGYCATLIIDPKHLPLKLVSSGKQYEPREPNNLGLYGTCQSTAVQVFCASREEQVEQHIEDVLRIIHDVISPFDLHYRVVYTPAQELQMAESLRIRVEAYSKLFDRFVELGSVSCYDDFISKRLLFNYQENSEMQFPHLVSGTVCNVTRLIGLLLERSGQNFRMPDYLEGYSEG